MENREDLDLTELIVENKLPIQVGIVGVSLIAALETQNSFLKTEDPFEVVSADKDKIILRQSGNDYTLRMEQLSAETKAKIIKENPKLASFLGNGPIKILNTENVEK